MCDAAFSSNSVLQKVMPLLPTSDFSSTSATSPSSDAFASTASSPRTSSAPVEALTSLTRPFSKVISRSRTTVPPTRTSGWVARTFPSVRRQSGVVNTSSVGRFGT